MDKVFDEEKRNLSEIKRRIKAIVTYYHKKADQILYEKKYVSRVDYSDRDYHRILYKKKEKATQQAEEYKDCLTSPYYGRLDLDEIDGYELKTKTHYIGEKGIGNGKDIIVLDWRTPIASCYRAENQKEFEINGRRYSLSLKRALQIENGELTSYHTYYDGGTISLDGEVIDSFLLTVLKDKRRHHQLTNIIRTIQGNQNEIIRKEPSENFVVQGCAGSGKTMILLHRLSYLQFNNLLPAGTAVITPNTSFDNHISSLSEELELRKIRRFTVDEYYKNLIRRYHGKHKVAPYIERTVRSEKKLNANMLTKIYSLQFIEELISEYHKYWIKTLGEINEATLKKLFEKSTMKYPDTTMHTFSVAENLKNSLNEMIRLKKKRDNLISELVAANTDFQNYSNSEVKNEKELKEKESRKWRSEQAFQKFQGPAFTAEEEIFILNCIDIIQNLQYENISQNVVIIKIKTQYEAYHEQYIDENINNNCKNEKKPYRHELYLELLLSSLYFANLEYTENFLNVDEAQDISQGEYCLLKTILGEKCVFNLYGDTRQNAYSYKGINDWGELEHIVHGNIYTLNENYRNTLQITDFCNKEFGMNVTAIGLSGEPVQTADLETAVKWIVDLKRKNPEYRVAIIHQYGMNRLSTKLKRLLRIENEPYSRYNANVNDNVLFVSWLEYAKGLEFEAVVAIIDQMTENEKYIAYTRALEHLVIVQEGAQNPPQEQ